MSFEDDLVDQFEGFTIPVPTASSHLEHLYADYAELIALFSNKNHVTLADVADRIGDEGDSNEQEVEIDSGDEIGSDQAEKTDEELAWTRSIFNILDDRAIMFAENYPFEYTNNRIRLRDDISDKQKLYLMLLVASNLNVFTNVSSELTSEFESVSYHALRNYLPNFAQIKQFGKNSDYNGNAKAKIRNLAMDMNIEVNEYALASIPDRNNQERGLDVIGWMPFEDRDPTMIVILGQCACGKKWHAKQHETPRYEKYLMFYTIKPTHSLFIPYALIDLSNGFFESDEIMKGCLMFERLRILDFIDDLGFFEEMNSKTLIDRCLEFEEDIV